MKESNKKEKREFLINFCNSSSMQSFKEMLSDVIKKNRGCQYFDPELNPLGRKKDYGRGLLKIVEGLRSNPPKGVKLLKDKRNRLYLVSPVAQGDTVYGYVAMCDLKRKLEPNEISFMKIYMELALKEFQKEQELKKVYSTIRPRAIALSTIHTIHRLLSSTLDMNELIERIARLTSQVMRVKECSIMLLEGSKKRLISKAMINIENHIGVNKNKPKRIKLGSGIEGKVAKTGKIHMSRSLLCIPLVEEDIIGVITVKHKINERPLNEFDLEILLTLGEQAVIAIINAQLYEEQERMAYGSIKSLSIILDAKSPNTFTHSERFVKIVMAIAEEMHLRREDVRNLRYAALLPDTGKFSIPDEILKKQGGLSRKEYNIIKKQHLESLKILEPLEFLKPSIPIIRYHHERYDGAGYPSGLKGKEIPIGARIMAVAESFEAMLSLRPYKNYKISITQAMKEIRQNSGKQFDPEVVEAFLSLTNKPVFKTFFLL
ncbi:MAG: HD domain-containing phosphohydrolase [Candidatus Omnitrophota bacterium]